MPTGYRFDDFVLLAWTVRVPNLGDERGVVAEAGAQEMAWSSIRSAIS